MSDCDCACHTSGTAFARPCDVPGGCGHLHGARRCEFPGCQDPGSSEHLPRPLLTTEPFFCESSRRRYRRILDWVLDDYLIIHAAMPSPLAGNGVMVTVTREYGHPAEWASDMKRQIASVVDAIADGLREHLGHTPANPTRREARQCDTELRYLTAQFEQLCLYPHAVDSANDLDTLHQEIRRALGQTRASVRLSTPCPECGLLTMRRTVELDRSDTIECMHCHHTIAEQYYGLYTRMVLDDILDGDTPNGAPAA